MTDPSGAPPRVLVLSGAASTATAVQLALAARALVADGVSVSAATPNVALWRALSPNVHAVDLIGEPGTREHRSAVTALVEDARPSVLLTDDELLRRVAVRALAPGACVLQRVPLGDDPPPDSVAGRFSSRRVAPAWLRATTDGDLGPAAPDARVPSLPMPFCTPVAPHEQTAPRRERAAERILVIANIDAASSVIPALRAAAQVARRHPALRIALCGEEGTLQPLRVHAAALRIADQIDVMPMPEFTLPPPPDTLVTWVAASGDLAATAALWSMSAGHPVFVHTHGDAAALVADHVSGILLSHGTPSDDAAAASSIARLLAHARERRLMADAARRRARQFDDVRLARAMRSAIERAHRSFDR